MTQPALRFASSAPRSIDASIDRYLAATLHRLERTLVSTIPSLAEPRVEDPGRALRRIGLLVETLAGFALGSIIGAARRDLGDAVRRAVTAQLVQLALPIAPSLTALGDRLVDAPRFLDDPGAQPLLDTLGSQLHFRLFRSMRDARAALSATHTTIFQVAPEQLGVFAAQLERLADDDTSAITFADHLAIGWQHYCASLGAGPSPELPDEPRWRNTRALWQAWRRRIDGPAAPAAPTHEQVVTAGFLLRVG